MIKYFVFCKSNHWPARLKKVDQIVNKVLGFKKDLNFKSEIEYNCNIILADNKLLKKMNYKYRKKNIATDVLTFISNVNTNNIQKKKFCDIFLSAQIIKKDSLKNNISFYDHLNHLLVHSFLHINGFTHKHNKDFNIMKKNEINILDKMNIKDPYRMYK